MNKYNQGVLQELIELNAIDLVTWSALRSYNNLNKLHYLACDFVTSTDKELGTIGEVIHYMYNSGVGHYARQIDAMLQSEGIKLKIEGI